MGVNLFLYQVTPNGTFRNIDAPTRRSDGTLLQPTRSAYDLHYLLTFYGSEANLEPQRAGQCPARFAFRPRVQSSRSASKA